MILSVRKLLFLEIPLILVILTGITFVLFLPGNPPQKAHAQTQQLAFPTAEGFGRFATGGRGGYVCHVDTTSSANTGSQILDTPHHQGTLPYCLQLTGPRTIIFDVAGTIRWDEGNPVFNSYVTIAGHTAPGQGIMLRGVRFGLSNEHVIVRYLRHRPGSEVAIPSAWYAIRPHSGSNNHIYDHTSLGWATDDTIGPTGNATAITYQWSIISEGLGYPGDNQKAALNSSSGNVSYLHNLFTHFADRAPWIQGGNVQIVNNVIYNIGTYSPKFWAYTAEIHAEMIGNYLHRGPSSGSSGLNTETNAGNFPNSELYYDGNFHNVLRPTDTGSEYSFLTSQPGTPFNLRSSPLGGFPAVTTTSAVQARTDVTSAAGAGAYLPVRDSIDQRQIDNLNSLSGSLVNQDEDLVGGYPTYSGTPRDVSYDTDSDGMPNTWETTCGLNPSDPLDGAQTAPNGYTNLENFLNKLAGDTIPQGDCGGLGGGSTDSIAQLHEAESMTLSAPMTVGTDSLAFNNQYISPTSGSDSTTPVAEATKTIAVPATGTYYLWARTNGPTAVNDALYMGINGSWDRFFPSTTGVYEWVRIETSNASGVYGFSLAAGNHTIQSGHGEINTRLDAFWITNDANALPPATATPTPTPSGPTACYTLDNTQPVPSGYAASYNPFTVQKELLLTATCNATNTTVTLGNGNMGDPTNWDGRMWVWNQGYQLFNNTWQATTYACSGEQIAVTGGAWCRAEATGTIDAQATAYLGYTCQWHTASSSYKCGCSDTACTTPLWHAQQIQP